MSALRNTPSDIGVGRGSWAVGPATPRYRRRREDGLTIIRLEAAGAGMASKCEDGRVPGRPDRDGARGSRQADVRRVRTLLRRYDGRWVCDDQFFVKPTSGSRAFAGAIGQAPPYLGAKPYLVVDADRRDGCECIARRLSITTDELPMPEARPKRHAKQGRSLLLRRSSGHKGPTFLLKNPRRTACSWEAKPLNWTA